MKVTLPRSVPGEGPGIYVVASLINVQHKAVAAVALTIGLENEGRSPRLAPVDANLVSGHGEYWFSVVDWCAWFVEMWLRYGWDVVEL